MHAAFAAADLLISVFAIFVVSELLLQVPAWRGRTNVELMLDSNSRLALRSLMEESGVPATEGESL